MLKFKGTIYRENEFDLIMDFKISDIVSKMRFVDNLVPLRDKLDEYKIPVVVQVEKDNKNYYVLAKARYYNNFTELEYSLDETGRNHHTSFYSNEEECPKMYELSELLPETQERLWNNILLTDYECEWPWLTVVTDIDDNEQKSYGVIKFIKQKRLSKYATN